MMQGTIRVKQDKIYIFNRTRRIPVASGQYLYLKVQNCWIPVVVYYSDASKKWCFEYLKGVDVDGQSVVLKE